MSVNPWLDVASAATTQYVLMPSPLSALRLAQLICSPVTMTKLSPEPPSMFRTHTLLPYRLGKRVLEAAAIRVQFVILVLSLVGDVPSNGKLCLARGPVGSCRGLCHAVIAFLK